MEKYRRTEDQIHMGQVSKDRGKWPKCSILRKKTVVLYCYQPVLFLRNSETTKFYHNVIGQYRAVLLGTWAYWVSI